MSTENTLVANLNKLLELCYDAEEGYKTASKDVDNLPLKEFFKRKAHERRDFGLVLKEEIISVNGKPDKGSSLKGDLHRAWIGIKAALAAKKYKVVLEECERGEQTALQHYDKVLKETTMPEKTREVLLTQYNQIESDLSELRDLKLSMK